jgi:hypothetical protein
VKQLQFIEEHPLIRPLSEYAVRFGTCGEDTKRHGDFSKANRCVVPVSPMQQENKS